MGLREVMIPVLLGALGCGGMPDARSRDLAGYAQGQQCLETRALAITYGDNGRMPVDLPVLVSTALTQAGYRLAPYSSGQPLPQGPKAVVSYEDGQVLIELLDAQHRTVAQGIGSLSQDADGFTFLDMVPGSLPPACDYLRR